MIMAASRSFLLAFLSTVVLVEGGVVPDVPENRIIGGYPIDITEAPWQVFLHTERLLCGGSIISDRWVLTAAHCTDGSKLRQMKLLAGTRSLNKGGIWYDVEQVVIHEEYNNIEQMNDISLLKTTKEILLVFPVKPVRLPAPGSKRPPAGTQLRVTGWGRMEFNEQTTFLMAVGVILLDYRECRLFGESHEPTQLCAGLAGRDSCSGDAGGALVMGNLQVGIVSYRFTQRCGLSPGVYTDVAVYRDWIHRHSGV